MDDASSFNPDAFIAEAASPVQADAGYTPVSSMDDHTGMGAGGFDPDSFLKEANEAQYGTLGQQAITGLEGAAKGVAGPLATLAETEILGVNPEDIRARAETNPVTAIGSEVAGFVAGAATGVGEAALLAKVGAGAAKAAGLANAVSTGAKIGSLAVQMAAENAVFQAGDEVGKMILKDPEASAQTALANIGLAAGLGAATGGVIGSVSPLWKATVGPKFEESLGFVKRHINGGEIVVPEALDAATKELGVGLDPYLKAAMAGDETAQGILSNLRYSQNETIHQSLDKMRQETSEAVMKGMGLDLAEAQTFSRNELGHNLEKSFLSEFKTKYGPIAEQMEARNAEAAHINIADEARRDQYGRLIEKAIEEVGTDAPAYKLYEKWGQRMMAKENIGAIDKLRTEIFNDIQMAFRAGDNNTAFALKSIRNSLGEFQENQIVNSFKGLGKEAAAIDTAELARLKAQSPLGSAARGIKDEAEAAAKTEINRSVTEFAGMGEEMLAQRQAANASYKDFAALSNELMDHIGTGSFKGAGSLMRKIESVGAETLLSKFSPKNNADILPFLQKHFPETLAQLRKSELLELIKPAINSAKGENPIDINRLSKILDNTMAGRKELAEFALGPDAIRKIQAGKTVLDAIPMHKDSGTAGGLLKVLKGLPSSATAVAGSMLGHNPLFGAAMGHLAGFLGKDVPDKGRLAYLAFLSSDKPVNAAGMKAASDFITQVAKGEKLVSNGVKNVFKAGAVILPESKLPTEAGRAKLDKLVADSKDKPTDQMQKQGDTDVGHYLPQHAVATASAPTAALAYLQQLKPQPVRLSPLDKEVPPSAAATARYNRALDIAQSPVSVMQHVKDGTLQPSDIQDMAAMYPALYKGMSQKLSNELISAASKGETIPYSTRMGVSLFIGQPVDSSLTPAAIMAVQPKVNGAQPPPQAQKNGKISAKAATGLEKMAKTYATPTQNAEKDRGGR